MHRVRQTLTYYGLYLLSKISPEMTAYFQIQYLLAPVRTSVVRTVQILRY